MAKLRLWRLLLSVAIALLGLQAKANARLVPLDFRLPKPQAEQIAAQIVPSLLELPAAPKPLAKPKQYLLPTKQASWWSGSEGLVAVAVGSAEGTRLPDGSKTSAYYWHVDPGNGADNYGSFSYQHLPVQQAVQAEQTSAGKRQVAAELGLPEQSDEAQLARLKQFEQGLLDQAAAKGIQLSDAELLNGIDLANQSEEAGLTAGGYIDRLAEVQAKTSESEGIIEARTNSYWSPTKQRWDAPGLGDEHAIRADQTRRAEEIASAIIQFQN